MLYTWRTSNVSENESFFHEIGTAEEVNLTGKEKFRVTVFLPVIDKLCAALNQPIGAYSYLQQSFAFLSNITKLTVEELKAAASKLTAYYPTDLEDGLESEIVHFAHLMKSVSEPTSMTSHMVDANSPELNSFLLIHGHNLLETFANVETALRLYLCIFVTNCTGERSFSKLKLIKKNYLRNTMGQKRLSSLSLSSIEHEQLKDIEFNDVITNFAQRKVCKQPV